MKRLSVEQAFAWTQAFAAREWRLLLPVALAFFGLPGLLVDVFMPNAMQALMPGAAFDAAAQGRAMAAMLGTLAVNMLGALAITALALLPAISVGEALARALRRLPVLIGAVLLIAAALVAALLVAALAIGAAHIGAARMQGALFAIVFAAGAVLWVRLCPIIPVLVERAAGPGHVLSLAWTLSGGVFWRLAGGLAAYFIGGLIVLTALGAGLGTVVTLLMHAAGAGAFAIVVNAILFRTLASVVSAGFQLLIAGLYRQLVAQGG